jgi:hypothetical protein
MTEKELVDYFAGQVLAGLCASSHLKQSVGMAATIELFCGDLAKDSYAIAKAMMRERERLFPYVKPKPTPASGDGRPF